MKTVPGKEFARVLEKNRWNLLRIQGSPHIYGKEGTVNRLSIPIHGSASLKIGLLKNFLDLAGLSEADLK